jgi:hypothetical protein
VLPAHRVVLVGAEFDMNATLDRPELDREIAAYIELDGKPVWVTYRVRFTGGWSVDRGEFSAEAPVTPESVPNRPGARTEVRGLAYASEFAYFTCTAPGKTEIDYVVNAYRTAEATPAGAASDLGFPSRELELGIFYKTWKGGFTDSPRAHPATVECVTTLPSPSPTPTRTPTAAAGHVRSDVLVIGGEHYPREQFAVGEPDACNTRHWHASTRVYSIEGTKQTPQRGILDPAPGECGFGKVGEVPVQALDIPEADWRAYRTALGGG